ncbi:MAG TPA: ArsR family transcriptional regulator [Alicycliphilus sp.]|nr:ArsR family transcriptional regulator [Alicycliphilus sp.]
MTTNFAAFLAEDRRLVILRVLAELPAYRTNSFLLHTLLAKWGHEPSTDQVKGDLAWLREQQLVTVDDVEGVYIATLTTRGADVAAGRAMVPGVKRPGA